MTYSPSICRVRVRVRNTSCPCSLETSLLVFLVAGGVTYLSDLVCPFNNNRELQGPTNTSGIHLLKKRALVLSLCPPAGPPVSFFLPMLIKPDCHMDIIPAFLYSFSVCICRICHSALSFSFSPSLPLFPPLSLLFLHTRTRNKYKGHSHYQIH